MSLLNKIQSHKGKVICLSTALVTALTPLAAHAEDTASSTGLDQAQTAVVGSLTSGKTEVIAFLLGVLGVGTAIYLFKFGVKQGFNFFNFLASRR